MSNETKELTLRERFDSFGFSLAGYARSRKLPCRVTLGNVLNGIYTGKRNRKGSKARACILQLKEDGVWIDELPWDEETEVQSA